MINTFSKPVQRWVFVGILVVIVYVATNYWYNKFTKSDLIVYDDDNSLHQTSISGISTEQVSVTLPHSTRASIKELDIAHDGATETHKVSLSTSPKAMTTLTPTTSSQTSTPTTSAPTSTHYNDPTLNYTGDLRGWDSGSFCDDFLHRTFQQVVPVCSADHASNKQPAVTCKRSPRSSRMIECSMANVLIRPKMLYNAVTHSHIVNSGAVELLDTDSTVCESPDLSQVHKTTESGDHVRGMVEEAVRQPPTFKQDNCQRWIEEPTFLFQGNNVHVYFEFLAWYNTHKSILDQGRMDSYRVFRVAASSFKYLFDDYEKLLFPGIEFMHNMTEETVCFKRLILPPGCFASLLFRCKMEYDIRGQCFNCNGKGRPGTAIRSFRSQALKACSLDDPVPLRGYRNPKKIVIILRKQYHRHPSDKPENFNRVLSNSEQLIAELENKTNTTVVSFYGEDLPVCEQIRIVHEADIFIGVHGAGLVHSLWLQDIALLFEIVPRDQSGNKTFKMLTKLAGINYKEFPIGQMSVAKIAVDVNHVIDVLINTIQNGI